MTEPLPDTVAGWKMTDASKESSLMGANYGHQFQNRVFVNIGRPDTVNRPDLWRAKLNDHLDSDRNERICVGDRSEVVEAALEWMRSNPADADRSGQKKLLADGGRQNAGALRDAYDELDYQMVECTESLSVPVSDRARFEYARPPSRTDAEEIKEHIDRSGYSFTDALAQNGENWYEFSVTGTLWGGTDEMEELKVSVTTSGVSLMRTRREVSFQTFQHVVTVIEDALDAELEHRGEEA